MTVNIAITGKSGSGKTTIAKSFYLVLRKYYPNKTILLFDNDLTQELGYSFNLDVRNTIYGIKSGKHQYKSPIPEKMTKQEYIEWALEDILVKIDDKTDMIVCWLVGTKDCRCPIVGEIKEALLKLINYYDFVIYDCEFDLKYLNQLFDPIMDVTLIVTNEDDGAINLARRINDFSAKYAYNGQMSIVLNKMKTNNLSVFEKLKEIDLDVIGTIPFDEKLTFERKSKIIENAVENMYLRLNLPQKQED